MQSGASFFSGGGRSIVDGSPAPRKVAATPVPTAAPLVVADNPALPAAIAASAVGCSLKPGEAAMYRHRITRDPVKVTRFGGRQTWEDKAAKMEYFPVTGKMEYAKERVTPADVEIKPSYSPGFLFPALALDAAYEWDAALPDASKAA